MSSYKYDPKSLKAEEFINHEEILETLRYAEELLCEWMHLLSISSQE